MANSHHTSSSGDIQSSINKAQVATNSSQLSIISSAVATLQTTQKANFLDNHTLDCRPFGAYTLTSGNSPTEGSVDVSLSNGLWRRMGLILAQKDTYSGYGRNSNNTRIKPPSAGYYIVIYSIQADIDASDTTTRTLNFRMSKYGTNEVFSFKRTLKNDTGVKAYYNINHTQIVNLHDQGKYSFDVMSDGADQNNLSSATSEIILMRINSSVGSVPPIYAGG